jgi:hypothetical protein
VGGGGGCLFRARILPSFRDYRVLACSRASSISTRLCAPRSVIYILPSVLYCSQGSRVILFNGSGLEFVAGLRG